MIQTITLQNFKSFGELQTVPLEPITVLVGPNNSGKSNFMSVGRFIKNSAVAGLKEAVKQEGRDFLFHRPPDRGAPCTIGWSTTAGSYSTVILPRAAIDREEFKRTDTGASVSRKGALAVFSNGEREDVESPERFIADEIAFPGSLGEAFYGVWNRLLNSATIKLSLSALRADSEVIPHPVLGSDGRGLAAVLGLWRGSMPENVEALEQFLTRCLPEVQNVFVRPAPSPGHQRLWFRQKDGQQFDAEHISDGVLAFTALAMHAISAEEGELFFIEEPEQSIHPKRLRELVDLLKDVVRERKCQFVIATHSTVLLNAFRDEPEAILLFRRSETGTRVKRLSDVPELLEALQKAPPGDLLETGAFSAAF